MALRTIIAYDQLGHPYTTWTNRDDYPSEPGTPISSPPVLDFSDDEGEDDEGDSGQPQQAQQPRPGQQPTGERGSAYSSYTNQWDSNSEGLDTQDVEDYMDERPEDFGYGEEDDEEPRRKPPRIGRPASAPQSQPYTPMQSAYDPSGGPSTTGGAGYGGLGAAGEKEVWGASYGGMGEDPYLKSMQNFTKPFHQYFTQMMQNHF
jgi:hypothetical protein